MKYRFKIHLPLIGALVSMTACQVTEPSLAETPPAPIIAEPAQTPQVAQKIAPTKMAPAPNTKTQKPQEKEHLPPSTEASSLLKEHPSASSLLIWDGEQHFGLVHADSATLQGLANNLRTIPLPNFKIKYALNLDGGTSCDLWVSNQITGGPINKRTFFTKKARNYLVLKKR